MDHHEEQDHLIECKEYDECWGRPTFLNSCGWNNHHKTILIRCIERHDFESLVVFLGMNKNPNVSRQGVTALTFAVEKNLPDFVQLLVLHGACFTCEKGVEALELMVSNGFFKELIKGEEILSSRVQSNKLFKTAIIVAFESGRQTLLTKLLHCGLPLERSLLLDVTLTHPGLVKILIDNGVNVNVTTLSLDTALHKAAQNNNIGSIQLLIQANSHIHAVNENGETALYNAVCLVNSREHYKTELSPSDKDINLEIIQLLLEAKSDINFKDPHGDTLLHKAVQLGKTDVVKVLIEAGADANAINNSGETVLLTASAVGHGEVLKLLIGATSNINATDALGDTVVHKAVDAGNIEILKQLMGIISDINVTNAQGDTVLHKAARKNNFEITNRLITAKINIGAVNKNGETALHAASTVVYPTTYNKNCTDIVNFKPETGMMDVLTSSVYTQCAIVQSLIEAGANINLEDINGDTPLSLAVVNDNPMLAHILIHKKADVNKLYKRNKGDKSTSAPSHFVSSSVSVGTCNCVSTKKYKDLMSVLTPAPSVLWMTATRQYPLTEMAKLLIHHGADVNVPNANKTTILMLAVDQLEIQWMEFIIAAGADVDAVDNFGNTALTLALRRPFPEIKSCKRLISLGYHSHQFLTRTHSADAFEKSQTAVHFLLKAGCSINTPYFPNPMVMAVIGGHKDYVKLLLERGGNVEAQDSKGNTLIMLAIENNYLDIFEILMASGADVINVKNKFGDLPLHFAAKSQMMKIVIDEIVIKGEQIEPGIKRLEDTREKFINFDVLNERLETPLYKAAAHGRCKNVKLLLRYGASANIQSKNGNTPLMMALKHGFENVAKVLLAAQADVNVCNGRGENALLFAAKSGCTETMNDLIKTGGDPLTTTNVGGGELSLAANTNIAKLFADAGADINLRNIHGKTPLHCAVKQGKEGVVRLLLDLGANVNMKDFNGNTPLITAHRVSQPGIILCLLGAKADVNLQNKCGKSALMYASDMNNKVFCKKQSPEATNTFDLLLTSGADVNLQDNIGRTALMYSYKEKIECASCDKSQKLVKHGADLEAKDYQGRTSLVQVLLAYGMNSRIIELLKLGANPVIDAKYRNLLMQPSDGFEMDENEKRNQLLRLIISNGIFNQMCFVSYFPMMAWELTTCVLELCLLCDSYDLLKYILANCCLSNKDLAYIRRRQKGVTMRIVNDVHHEMDEMVLRAGSRPWPLFKLAFMAVSTMMGESPEREVRIGNSQLPNPLKDLLMFQTEVARTPIQEWSKLPEAMCFET